MNDLAFYSVLHTAPSRDRHELVTIGLVIYWRGKWDVRILPDCKKLHALNPAFPNSGLLNIAKTILALLNGVTEFAEARRRLAALGDAPGLQKFVGQFPAENTAQYQSEIQWLMQDLVLLPAPPKPEVKQQPGNSRLRTRLRKHFKKENLLSSEPDQIAEHKIVEHYPIAESQGLYAQFALKNGAMHITETVDFDVSKSSVRPKILEAQAKTLILSAAKQHFGANTKRYVVVAGSDRTHAKPSINLLRDYGDVYAIESAADMANYFDKISLAART